MNTDLPPLLMLWPDSALYAGPGFNADLHRHHALQISVGLDEAVHFRETGEADWRSAAGVMISADQPHELRCRGAIVVLFVAPESELQTVVQAQWLSARPSGLGAFSPDVAAIRRQMGAFRNAAAGHEEARGLRRLLAGNGGDRQAPAADSRVEDAVAYIQAHLDRKLPAQELAVAAGLSADHLMKIFRQSTGLSLRQYILWSRIRRAVQAVVEGMSLTDAAMEAGFTDAAHFSNSFRATFGLAPGLLNLVARQGRLLMSQA